MLGDFEQKLVMATLGAELLFSCAVLVAAALPRSHSPLHREPVGTPVCVPPFWNAERSSFSAFMVVLKYWSPLFCFGPRDCSWKWLLLSLVLHLREERSWGGATAAAQDGSSPHSGQGQFLDGLPEKSMAFLCAPHSSTNSPSLFETHKALLVNSCLLPLDLCRRSV